MKNNSFRFFLSKIIPFRIRRRFKIWVRNWRDFHSGDARKFILTKKINGKRAFSPQIELETAFKKAEFVENKIQNIRLAAQKINQFEIPPGAVFSFWKIVGPPVSSRGFLEGRTILNGKLRADSGGGLCQLSSMLYYLALKTGLKIKERHAHSVDFYAENERFLPLGSDATVFFGYKDLRFENSLDQPIWFEFEITNDKICAKINAPEKIFPHKIEFFRHENEAFRIVNTLTINELGKKTLLAESIYRIPK
jgi:vancomycin resistance protein VanW